MSATIVSYAQFQESRQRRQASGRVPSVPPRVDPEHGAADAQPLIVTSEAPEPAPAPRDPSPQPQ